MVMPNWEPRMQYKVMAVVPAAGSGTRMGAGPAKQFLSLGGAPVLSRTLMALEKTPVVEAVVVIAPPGGEADLGARCIDPYGFSKIAAMVPGGAERQDSVSAGVAVAAEFGSEWVLVHDAARPLVKPELFARVLEAAQTTGAAVAALPCQDTIKQARDGGLVQQTLDRSRLWQIQTPQGFRVDLLQKALQRAEREGFKATDEAGLMERAGHEVRLVLGAKENLKITTPEDLRLARGWLEAGSAANRVGQGMDVHKFAPDRPLVLGGVFIDYEFGLLGHSDADVVTHALMDALLAAAGLGDIGGMFSDTDPAYAGANSLDLLSRVVERLAGEGWRPKQTSVTCVAQKPKLAPHAEAMRLNIASRLGLDPSWVNIAATTTEGLGFTGRGEGIAALATAVIAPLAADI
jgi:2-C-methyl-D-erythritol 4-phosphate cytidylyltransferase/2-C-methyl-D-erythritol 2,4-cyclodiphosphate synthase